MVSNVLGIVATLGVMVWTSWRVSLVLLLLAPAMAWMMGKVGKRYRRLNHAIQESAARMLQTAGPGAQRAAGRQGVRRTGRRKWARTARRRCRTCGWREDRGHARHLSMLVQVLGALGVAVMWW